MKIHKIPINTDMKIYEDNLSNLMNFKRINDDLERDILSHGDSQNKKTNVQADMTDWQMASRYKSFENLLKIIIIQKIPNFIDNIVVSGKKAEFVCTGMWGIIYNKGDFTVEHNHVGSTLSFTYYVKATENSSPICFTQPGKKEIIAKTGTLLIWDAAYMHKVPEQPSSEKRIAVAGNLNWKLPEISNSKIN